LRAGCKHLHSASTKSLSFMKSGNVSFVREETSEAEATAAPMRPSAMVLKVRILDVANKRGLGRGGLVSMLERSFTT
jgi:hypothetical protein